MKNLILIVLLLLLNSANAQNLTEYILKIDSEQPYRVSVKVKFAKEVDTLSIHPSCPNYDYPRGWSTFITPLSKDLKFLANSMWQVDNQNGTSYEVDLSFVKEKWDVGNEQAGIYINESMLVVTRALFLTNDMDEKFKVTFDIPHDYSVAAPWTSLGENQFLVNSVQELTDNILVWGKQATQIIEVGDFNLQIVLLGYDKKVDELVKKTFFSVLSEYVNIFPQTPKSNYLIAAFPAAQNDGEAYTTSNAFTLKSPISDQTKVIWANQFAHELFHFWNGKMINGPERNKRQWFSEGFTEYFANLTLARTGIISEDEFFRLIEKTIGLYFYFKDRQFSDVSLADAGVKKSKYRFGVYNGGWCAAFVMDMMIREKFSDKSLEDYMNKLFVKFGITQENYVLNDLEKEFDVFFGDDNKFFDRYILGLEPLPIQEYMNKLGVIIDYTSYEATAFLFIGANQDEEKIRFRNKWLKELDTLPNKK